MNQVWLSREGNHVILGGQAVRVWHEIVIRSLLRSIWDQEKNARSLTRLSSPQFEEYVISKAIVSFFKP